MSIDAERRNRARWWGLAPYAAVSAVAVSAVVLRHRPLRRMEAVR